MRGRTEKEVENRTAVGHRAAKSTASPARMTNGKTQGESSVVGEASSSEEVALDPRYPIYWQYYIHLAEQRSESQTELDKSILNLSLGSLGASFAVITAVNLIESRIVDLPLVFFSWIAFCFAIVATTESFNSSVKDYGKCIDKSHSVIFGSSQVANDLSNSKGVYGETSKFANFIETCKEWFGTEKLNTAARLSFYAGIGLLLVFVGLNLLSGKPNGTTARSLPPVTNIIRAQSTSNASSISARGGSVQRPNVKIGKNISQ